MTTWIDRFRIALLLSPAFFLVHAWILASSNGLLLQNLGMPLMLFMMVISSVVEAYIFVMAAHFAYPPQLRK